MPGGQDWGLSTVGKEAPGSQAPGLTRGGDPKYPAVLNPLEVKTKRTKGQTHLVLGTSGTRGKELSMPYDQVCPRESIALVVPSLSLHSHPLPFYLPLCLGAVLHSCDTGPLPSGCQLGRERCGHCLASAPSLCCLGQPHQWLTPPCSGQLVSPRTIHPLCLHKQQEGVGC